MQYADDVTVTVVKVRHSTEITKATLNQNEVEIVLDKYIGPHKVMLFNTRTKQTFIVEIRIEIDPTTKRYREFVALRIEIDWIYVRVFSQYRIRKGVKRGDRLIIMPTR